MMPAADHVRDEDMPTAPVLQPVTDPALFLVKRSPSFGAIAAALAKAQGEIVGAEKDRENPHFKSKYATLAAVWDACRLPLSKAGIAVFQPVTTEGVKVTVTTLLAHSSGEWIAESLTLKALQDTPQGIGSAMTYGRRYALAAMVGVAPEDDEDDGNAANGNGVHPQAQQNRREVEQRQNPKPAQRQSQTTARPTPPSGDQRTAPAASGAPAAASSQAATVSAQGTLPTGGSLDGATGKVANVTALPSGTAWTIDLVGGFKCGTRDADAAKRAEAFKASGVDVEIAARPNTKGAQYAPMLEWIVEVTPEPSVELGAEVREPGEEG